MKHLHELIRNRFEETLCLSFKPVASQRDYYFYCPADCTGLVAAADSARQSLAVVDSEASLDQSIHFRRSDSEDSVSFTSGESRPIGDLDLEADDDDDEDDDDDDDDQPDGEPEIPLFLHLTSTIRCDKQVISQSINSLPTCLGNLLTPSSGKNEALLRQPKVNQFSLI